MENKLVYRLSLILNGVFIVVFLFLGFRNTLFQNNLEKEEKLETEEKVKIVMFGDSITKGGAWNDLLKRNDIKNCGFGGFTTSHLVWLIKGNVIDVKPEICFIKGGINDIGVGIPLSRTKTNYQSLIDTLIAHNIVPVIQSTLYQENNPKSKTQVDSLNNFLIDLCKTRQVTFLDINSKLSNDSGLKAEYSKDGTHLTEAAYKIWSQEVQAQLDIIEIRNGSN